MSMTYFVAWSFCDTAHGEKRITIAITNEQPFSIQSVPHPRALSTLLVLLLDLSSLPTEAAAHPHALWLCNMMQVFGVSYRSACQHQLGGCSCHSSAAALRLEFTLLSVRH